MGAIRYAIVEDYGKFIASDSGHDVGWPNAREQRLSNAVKEFVSDFVSEPIVDLLEVVAVNEGHCKGLSFSFGPPNGLFGFFFKGKPVIDSGELIDSSIHSLTVECRSKLGNDIGYAENDKRSGNNGPHDCSNRSTQIKVRENDVDYDAYDNRRQIA
jgi:hypothetical protein